MDKVAIVESNTYRWRCPECSRLNRGQIDSPSGKSDTAICQGCCKRFEKVKPWNINDKL